MANTRRIGVQLDFTANMSQAKQAVNEFKQSLTNVMTTLPSNKMTATAVNSLKEAQVAAQQLDLALTRAFNKNTGNINITKFSQSLKSSGTNVKQLSNSLLNAGKVGQQSFLAMARALQQVERSTITINGLTQRLVTTLWNNVRWQVTSAAINSVTTSISDAVNHLKDMDNALNAIRVVSGDTKVEMQGVANEARRMAKDLKTSATEIVKAELIYRQQGDSAELAAKKAEITTKAANVSFNSSAEQMSEYLTAIWNSYQVPEDQLELFVDKIAAIGAETATSMEEIATAMQKVASTANNVGVSYDQLAAVIATVSSTTRQSAETVGTSFRTIFARIEDLKMGKTTEDGVILGNVSSDLKQMGIDIYDAQGELRQLGDVLEEMGAKWQTMSKEEQVALAQTVGGKRQYSMLMALMDNWDMYSETVKEAANAYGTLDEQQSIWAESWEAHAQNIQVSAEKLYNTLFKTDSFLDAMNFFAGFLDRTSDAVEAAGGLGNILLWVTTIVASKMTPQIMNGINSIVSGFDIISGRARKREIDLQNELTAQLKLIQASQAYTGQQKLEAGFLAENAQQKQKILKIEQNLSDKQKEEINSLLSVRNGWQEIALQEQAAIDKNQEYIESLNVTKATGKYEMIKDASVGISIKKPDTSKYEGVSLTKKNISRVMDEGIQSVYGQSASYEELAFRIGATTEQIERLKKASSSEKQSLFTQMFTDIKVVKPQIQEITSKVQELEETYQGKKITKSNLAQVAQEGIKSVYGQKASYEDLATSIGATEEQIKKLNQATTAAGKQTAFTQMLQDMKLIKVETSEVNTKANKLVSKFKEIGINKTNLTRVANEGIQAIYGQGKGIDYANLAREIGATEAQISKLQGKMSADKKRTIFAQILQEMKLVKPEMQDLNAEVDKIFADAQTQNIDFGRLSAGLSSLQSEAGDTVLSTTQVEEKLKELDISFETLPESIQRYIKSLDGGKFSQTEFQTAVDTANDSYIDQLKNLNLSEEQFQKIKEILEQITGHYRQLAQATEEERQAQERLNKELEKIKNVNAVVSGFGEVASNVMTASMAFTTLQSSIESFNDGDVLAGVTSLSMTVVSLVPIIPKIVVGIRTVFDAIKAGSIELMTVNAWIAVISVALMGIVAIVKAIQNNSLKAAAERLKESEEKVTSIKSELEEIDSKINDLTSSNETLTAEQAKQLQILKAQKAEKEGLLEIAEQENAENRKEVVAKATSELNKNEIYEKGQYSPEELKLEGKVIVGTKYTTTVTGNKQFDSYEEAQKAAVEAGYSASETPIEVTENYKVLNKAQIEDVYDQVKDLAYTQTDQEFNNIKAQATAQYFATIAASTEDATAAQKIYMSGLQQLFAYHSEFQNTEENINKLLEESAGNYAQVNGQIDIYCEAIEKMLGTEAANYWKENTQQQFENFKSLKQIADQCGITVDSLDDVNGALEELSKQTGIPKEILQSLYQGGNLAYFAEGGFNSLKTAANNLSNISVDMNGVISGLKDTSDEAIKTLNLLLALNGLKIVKSSKINGKASSMTPEEATRHQTNAKIMKGAGFGGTWADDVINWQIESDIHLEKNGKRWNEGEIPNLQKYLYDQTASGKTPSTPSTPSNPGSPGEEKDDDKADKIWWDNYEARKKQIEEDFAAGKIDQDKYLSELDAAYQDLISHYDIACEDHKDKILGELDDLKDKNASRNIELYKSISEAVQTYGYASFNYKGQQRIISSMEEADKFWTDELAGQTIEALGGRPDQSIYNRENLLDVNKTQWDNAKYISDEAWDQLQDDFENGRIGFQEYWDKKTSLLYGGAWDKESNSIKRFYTKDEIDKNLGSDQKQSDFLTWIDNIIEQYETAAKDGQDVKWQNVIAAIIEQWGLLPPYLQTRDIKEQVQSKIQSMLDNYISRMETDTDKGFVTPYQAKLSQEEVASFNWLGTPFEELAASSGKYYNQAQENFARRWENQSAYGDYIEGTDKDLRLAHLETIARNAVETRKNVLKTASVTSEEFAKAQKDVKDAGQAIIDEWYDQKITNAEGYLSWSKMFGFIEGDDSLEASLRMWDHIPEELKPKLKELVDQGVFTLEEAQKIYDAKVQSTYQSATSNMKEWLDFQRENTEEWINTQKTLLENSVSANQTNFDYQKSLRDSLHDINKELATSLTMYDYLDEETRKLLFNTDDYLELSGKIKELQEEGNALTDKYLKDIQGKSIKEQELITQAYEAQMELKSKEYEIAKQDLEVAKKKLALQNVLNERNIRMFLNGQWTWVANQEEVAKAQQDLMDAQYQAESARLELEFTQEQEKLNARIRGLQEQLNIIEDDFKRLDDLINGRDRSVVMTFEELRDEVARTYKDIAKMREEAERENKSINTTVQGQGTDKLEDYVKFNKDNSFITDEGYIGNIAKSKVVFDRGDYFEIQFADGRVGTIKKHATGGIFTVPHLAQFAEDGAEAVIPLSDKYRARGLELWNKAGNILGTLPQFSYKPSFAENGEQTIEQKVYVNIHNEDSTEDFYEINNLV